MAVRRLRHTFWCPLVAALALTAAAIPGRPLDAQQGDTAQSIALRMQERYNRIRDFQADFVQTFRGGLFPSKDPSKNQREGHVYVKRPGRMRWVYSKPTKEEVGWDGKKFYQYLPDANQANVADASLEGNTTIGVLFLSGKGDILRDFTPSLAPITQAGTLALKLTPKQDPDGEFFVVVIDNKSGRLTSFVHTDNQGGETTTRFVNLKEDTGIPDSRFEFSPPKGTIISSAGGR